MSTAEEQSAVDGRLRAAGERWRSAHPDAVPMSAAELVATRPDAAPIRSRTPRLPSQSRRIRFAPIAAAVLVVAGIASIALVVRADHRSSGAPQPSASSRTSGTPQSSSSPRPFSLATTELLGHRWVLTGWTINGVTTQVAQGDASQFAIDGTGHLTGSEGCKSIGGAVAVTATTVQFASVVPTIECFGPNYPVYQRIRAVWYSGSPAAWRAAGDHLYLTHGTETLNYQLAAPQTVSGTLIVAGGPGPGSPRPIEGTIEVHTGSIPDGPILVTIPTATDGRFQIGLEPGTYSFTGQSPSLSGVSCSSLSLLTLPGPSSGVEVVCALK